MALWRHVHESSSEKIRPVSKYRSSLTSAPAPTCGDSWNTRLHLGKHGPIGDSLASSIARFGTGTHFGPIGVQRMDHDQRTSKPLRGHTIRFNPVSKEEPVWYGVCCSTFAMEDVLGEQGEACRVRWFDLSYTGTWKAGTANYYHLTDTTQLQLYECMEDWGHLLVFDPETELFVDTSDESDNDTDGADMYGHPANKQWQEDLSQIAENEGTQPSKEELLVFDRIFRRSLLYYVDGHGRPRKPFDCGKGGQTKNPCVWSNTYAHRMNRLPLTTTQGPVFLTPVRYYCSTHRTTVTAGSKDHAEENGDPNALNIVYYRLGDMRYTTETIAEVQGVYVDQLTFAACRRTMLNRWLSHALQVCVTLKQRQAKLSLRSDKLQRATRVLLALEEFTPSDESIKELMLLLFTTMVKPQLARYDACVCAFDGQLIRIDGTFRCAAVVRAYAPNTGHPRGRQKKAVSGVYKKVGGCVLVAVGLEGLCLTTPRIVRAENGDSIGGVAKYTMQCRRQVLGSTSAPAAFVTDSIRQHKNILLKATWQVYPELAASVQESKCDVTDVILMMQDIPHREWVFTRQAATPKHHPDRLEYCADIKHVFHRLRVPYEEKQSTREEQQTCTWASSWTSMVEQTTGSSSMSSMSEHATRNHILRSILKSASSTRRDDVIAEVFIRTVGRAAVQNTVFLQEYIPERVLQRAARRLGIADSEVQALFPEQGYHDAEEFLIHLESTNAFYVEVRSQAHHEHPGVVVDRLGEWRGQNKPCGVLGSRRRHKERQCQENAPRTSPQVRTSTVNHPTIVI